MEGKEKDLYSKNSFSKHSSIKYIKVLKEEMFQAASKLEFEKAASLRDKIRSIENKELEIYNNN